MKKDIHPEYRIVIFKDLSADESFLGRSTMNSKETEKWEDGNVYPVIKLDISSRSHPFFTGKQKFVDTAGRVDKFFARYGKKAGAPAGPAEPAKEAATAE
jgi:large subunit ribosomal protein L31